MGKDLTRVLNWRDGRVRIDYDEQGEPWFCLKDLCVVLDIKNAAHVASRLDFQDKKTIVLNDGNRGNPNHSFVSEAGMYFTVSRSEKPEAREFLMWLCREVLPAIRQTGAYVAPNADLAKAVDMPAMLRQFADEYETLASHCESLERKTRLLTDQSTSELDKERQAHQRTRLERDMTKAALERACKASYRIMSELDERIESVHKQDDLVTRSEANVTQLLPLRKD